MDPLTVAAVVAALAAAGSAWHLRARARRAEQEAASLHSELAAERHAASHDPLTGLPNRRAFYQLGSTLIANPGRHPLLAVVLDLDDFKRVNDTLGHAAGDEVLVTVARRFAGYAGDNLVARVGGDEFAGLLASPTVDHGWLSHFAWRLSDAVASPMLIAGYRLTVTASIGLVPVGGCRHLADALRHADAAMYRAKVGGQARLGSVLPGPDGDHARPGIAAGGRALSAAPGTG